MNNGIITDSLATDWPILTPIYFVTGVILMAYAMKRKDKNVAKIAVGSLVCSIPVFCSITTMFIFGFGLLFGIAAGFSWLFSEDGLIKLIIRNKK